MRDVIDTIDALIHITSFIDIVYTARTFTEHNSRSVRVVSLGIIVRVNIFLRRTRKIFIRLSCANSLLTSARDSLFLSSDSVFERRNSALKTRRARNKHNSNILCQLRSQCDASRRKDDEKMKTSSGKHR